MNERIPKRFLFCSLAFQLWVTHFKAHAMQANAAKTNDMDLLRLALQKIQLLEGELNSMKESGSSSARSVPSPNSAPPPPPTPALNSESGNQADKEDCADDHDPIKTPDGVAAFWMQLVQHTWNMEHVTCPRWYKNTTC